MTEKIPYITIYSDATSIGSFVFVSNSVFKSFAMSLNVGIFLFLGRSALSENPAPMNGRHCPFAISRINGAGINYRWCKNQVDK